MRPKKPFAEAPASTVIKFYMVHCLKCLKDWPNRAEIQRFQADQSPVALASVLVFASLYPGVVAKDYPVCEAVRKAYFHALAVSPELVLKIGAELRQLRTPPRKFFERQTDPISEHKLTAGEITQFIEAGLGTSVTKDAVKAERQNLIKWEDAFRNL